MSDNIKGLIYTGGESSRMGFDKGGLPYYGTAQREYMAGLVSKFIGDVLLSCHPARVPESEFPVIIDVYDNIGPMGGLLSAFQYDTGSAWLTVPCDMPFVDEGVIEELMAARDQNKMATCFVDPGSGFPDPMLVIWEMSIVSHLVMAREAGRFSLKNILMGVDIKLVECAFPEKLRNVNTREEYEEVVKIIEGGRLEDV